MPAVNTCGQISWHDADDPHGTGVPRNAVDGETYRYNTQAQPGTPLQDKDSDTIINQPPVGHIDMWLSIIHHDVISADFNIGNGCSCVDRNPHRVYEYPTTVKE